MGAGGLRRGEVTWCAGSGFGVGVELPADEGVGDDEGPGEPWRRKGEARTEPEDMESGEGL